MEEDNVNNQYSSIYTRSNKCKIDLGQLLCNCFIHAPSDADFNASVVSSIIVSNEDTCNASTITLTLVGSGLDDTGATASTHLVLI